MGRWRCWAIRALTREPLHRDLPVHGLQVSRELGSSSITATLEPAVNAELVTQPHTDGLPILLPWATWLVAENPAGEIAAGGPLVRMSRSGPQLRVEAGGIMAWLARQYWLAEDRDYIQADPLQVVADLVGAVQDSPDAALGITVTGTARSPIRIGEPLYYEVDYATAEGKQDLRRNEDLTALGRASASASPVEDFAEEAGDHADADGTFTAGLRWSGMSREASTLAAPLAAIFAARNPDVDFQADPEGAQQAVVGFIRDLGSIVHRVDAEPYELRADEQPNIGSEIGDLAGGEPGFDLVEDPVWADRDAGEVAWQLRRGYPRIGARRDDLVLSSAFTLRTDAAELTDGDTYANIVIGRARGEGSDAPYRVATAPHDGIPRVMDVADLAASQRSRLYPATRRAVTTRSRMTTLESLTVSRTLPPSVVGDEVLARVSGEWGETSGWYRITAATWKPDDGEVTDVDVEPAGDVTLRRRS